MKPDEIQTEEERLWHAVDQELWKEMNSYGSILNHLKMIFPRSDSALPLDLKAEYNEKVTA